MNKARLEAVFPSYVLSFIYARIYWSNHHHLFHAVQRVNGRILWANLHLLFWLSLIPFMTGWMGGVMWIVPDPRIERNLAPDATARD